MPKTPKNKDFDHVISQKLHQAKVQPPDYIWQNIQTQIPQYSPWWTQPLSPVTSIIMNATVVISLLVTIYFVHKNTIVDIFKSVELSGIEETTVNPQNVNAFYDIKTISTVIPENHAGSNFIPPKPPQDITYEQPSVATALPVEQFIYNTSETYNIPLAPRNFSDFARSFPIAHLQKTTISKQHLVFPLEKFTTFAITAGYHPELYSYDTTLFGNKMSVEHKIFSTVQIFMDEFFIETGISIGQHRFSNTYKTEIWYNQEIAQYERVDSVEFVPYWDPVTNTMDYLPHFYTTPVTVTEMKHETKTEIYDDTYLYAHIPFSIGIQKSIKRLSFEPRIGLTYSMLISTTTKDHKVLAHNSSDIVQTELTLLTPPRLSSFWNFHCSLTFAIAISSSVDILVAPTYRYSLEPMFQGESPSRQSPLAFGLSTALRYKWSKP